MRINYIRLTQLAFYSFSSLCWNSQRFGVRKLVLIASIKDFLYPKCMQLDNDILNYFLKCICIQITWFRCGWQLSIKVQNYRFNQKLLLYVNKNKNWYWNWKFSSKSPTRCKRPTVFKLDKFQMSDKFQEIDRSQKSDR